MIEHTSPDRLLIYLVSLSGLYAVSRWRGLSRFHEGRGLPSLGLSVIACFVLTPVALNTQELPLETFVGAWCATHSLIFLFEVDGRVRWLTIPACTIACMVAVSAAFQTGRSSLLWLAAAVALLFNVLESLRLLNSRTLAAILPICLSIAVLDAWPITAFEVTAISLGMFAALVFARPGVVTDDGPIHASQKD